jgi:hypothetical protein
MAAVAMKPACPTATDVINDLRARLCAISRFTWGEGNRFPNAPRPTIGLFDVSLGNTPASGRPLHPEVAKSNSTSDEMLNISSI